MTKRTHSVHVLFVFLWFGLPFVAFNHQPCLAQSKIYVSLAGTGVGAVDKWGFREPQTNYFSVDLEYQRRFVGAINVLSGLSAFSIGYDRRDVFYSNYSRFRGICLAVPLMVRWNVGNENFVLIDSGIVPYYLLNAFLEERMHKFGRVVTVKGDITEFSHRFYFAYKFQMAFLLNRLSVGPYFLFSFKGQSGLKGLAEEWGLNAQQSVYLDNDGFADFYIVGLKFGIRVL